MGANSLWRLAKIGRIPQKGGLSSKHIQCLNIVIKYLIKVEGMAALGL